jgi:hypothetical protein
MGVLLVYLAVAVILFIAAFITRRRFGLLGLALAAGSLLNGIWGYEAGLVAGVFNAPTTPVANAAISCIVILLPAVLLLFHGDKYKSLIGRVIGALLFTLLAMAFLIEPLSHALILQGFGSDVYSWLANNSMSVIGVGLILAIIDLFLTRPGHEHSDHHKKH